MSMKKKLGRDPFESGRAALKGKRKRAAASVRRRAGGGRRPAVGPIVEIWRELTHYWLPKAKACVMVRAVRLAARFN